MPCTYTDLTVRTILEFGVFASYTEYHAFELGVLLPVACIAIAYFDERAAALTLSACVLAGFGIIPTITSTTPVGAKPWYFMGGLTLSAVGIVLLLKTVDGKLRSFNTP